VQAARFISPIDLIRELMNRPGIQAMALPGVDIQHGKPRFPDREDMPSVPFFSLPKFLLLYSFDFHASSF
jgi:hypothetical protein